MPAASSGPFPRISSPDDDEDDEQAPPPAAPGELLAQLGGLYGPGLRSAELLGAEVVRCLGDQVLSVELVAPGEEQGPLSGARARVEVDRHGRCSVTVPDPSATVSVSSGEGHERQVAAPFERYEVPATGRAIIRHGDATLLVRPAEARLPIRVSPLAIGLLAAGLLAAAFLALLLVR